MISLASIDYTRWLLPALATMNANPLTGDRTAGTMGIVLILLGVSAAVLVVLGVLSSKKGKRK